MLQITRKADYAVRLVMEVAAAHQDETVTTALVARRQEIPHQFLRKVAQTLTTHGVLTGERGGAGGLSLARPAEQISVLDVLRALDTPRVNDCSVNPDNCKRRSVCAAYPVWSEAQREMERILGRTPISRLARVHRAMQDRRPIADFGPQDSL
jgi:Rrf2 family protein